jgi:hypothetical protein
MSEHTPGPWHAQHRHVIAIGCGRDQPEPYDDHCIVDCVDGRTADEAVANARLIAAAPDAYEVCRLLSLRDNDDDPLVRDAEAVVAKVVGEESQLAGNETT